MFFLSNNNYVDHLMEANGLLEIKSLKAHTISNLNLHFHEGVIFKGDVQP